ncbi:MAG: cytochrome C oxidase subunit IV family protein [Blastocatellales bacterium]
MPEHIVPRTTYLTIFAVLITLTAVSVFVAYLDLGRMNVVAALIIAAIKALLIALYFMHIRYSARLTQVVVVGGVFWLMIMFALTMSDYLTRGWLSYSR